MLFEPDISPFRPPEFQKFLAQRRNPQQSFRVVFGQHRHDPDPSHLVGLLRVRDQRPKRGRTNTDFDEITSSHCLPLGSRTTPTMGLQQGFATGEMGFRRQVAQQ
jgi:hypothetical protein